MSAAKLAGEAMLASSAHTGGPAGGEPVRPRIVKELRIQEFKPTDGEKQLIREMYEWEKQSAARAQFRMA